ncbi:hypothetical protein [Sinomicrobium sp.]
MKLVYNSGYAMSRKSLWYTVLEKNHRFFKLTSTITSLHSCSVAIAATNAIALRI